jgi:hypothetical protein
MDQPQPSPPVTFETVGQDFYSHSPMARAAVRCGMSQEEFIRILLSETIELQMALVEAISIRSPVNLKFGEAPAKDPNMPEILPSSTSGKFSGVGDYLKPSVDIPAFEDMPDLTIDWHQDIEGRITDFRVTKGVARYKTPWWRKLLMRLLPGKGWTYVRFRCKP